MLSVEKYNNLKRRLAREARNMFQNKVNEFTNKTEKLEALSPLSILQRGFSIAYVDEGKILKSVEQAVPGNQVAVSVTDGKLYCTIDHIEKGDKND